MSWPRQRALSWRDLRAAPAQQQTHLRGGPDVLPCCQPPLLVSAVDTPLSPERVPAGSAPGVSLWRCAQALQASDRKMHQAEPVLYTFTPTAFVTPLWKPHLANSSLPSGSRRDECVLGVSLGQQNEDKFPHFYLFFPPSTSAVCMRVATKKNSRFCLNTSLSTSPFAVTADLTAQQTGKVKLKKQVPGSVLWHQSLC